MLTASERAKTMLPNLLSWPWRAWGVAGFFLCQWRSEWIPYSLPLMSVCGFLALWNGEFKTFPSRLNGLEWASLGFLLALLLSSFLGLNPSRSWALNGAAWPALVLYLLLRFETSKAEENLNYQYSQQAVFWGVVGLMLAQFALVSQAFWDQPAAEPADWVRSAASPWLVVPNDWSWVMVAVALLQVSTRCQRGVTYPRSFSTVLLVLAFLLAILLRSRGALLSGTAACLALFWQANVSRPVQKPWLWASGLILCGLLSLLLWWDAQQHFVLLEKFSRINDTRLVLWWAALQIFWHYPFFGVGPHNFVEIYQAYLPSAGGLLAVDPRLTPWPHQLLLEIPASMGILGLTPTIIALQQLACKFIKLPPDSGIKAALAGALAAFLCTAMIEASLLRLWTWVVVVLIFVAVSNVATSNNERSI